MVAEEGTDCFCLKTLLIVLLSCSQLCLALCGSSRVLLHTAAVAGEESARRLCADLGRNRNPHCPVKIIELS